MCAMALNAFAGVSAARRGERGGRSKGDEEGRKRGLEKDGGGGSKEERGRRGRANTISQNAVQSHDILQLLRGQCT